MNNAEYSTKLQAILSQAKHELDNMDIDRTEELMTYISGLRDTNDPNHARQELVGLTKVMMDVTWGRVHDMLHEIEAKLAARERGVESRLVSAQVLETALHETLETIDKQRDAMREERQALDAEWEELEEDQEALWEDQKTLQDEQEALEEEQDELERGHAELDAEWEELEMARAGLEKEQATFDWERDEFYASMRA
ncbi:hypothetical protein GE09DRAFT_1098474 [Coniochaeta sp. 2T2.1]|nr:hypothetical protein GE09DRAFT_1098474 [Coniochaeta sp. 2T2.1]